MIDGLSPAARALLASARDGMSPDAAAIRRMRGKIDAAVGATVGDSALAVKSTTVGGTVLALKVGLKVALIGLVGLAVGSAVHTQRDRVTRADRVIVAPQIELSSLQAETLTPVVRGAPAMIDMALAPTRRARPHASTVTAIVVPSRASPRPIAIARPSAAAPAPEPAGAKVPEVPRTIVRANLAREVELIDLAMSALRRRDTAQALAAIHTHATETAGAGQLAEDAAAIEIEALCRLRDETVTAKLATFDARFPRSAQRSRLTCR
jgi:hypothetical protein